jgi:hypothetical protein
MGGEATGASQVVVTVQYGRESHQTSRSKLEQASDCVFERLRMRKKAGRPYRIRGHKGFFAGLNSAEQLVFGAVQVLSDPSRREVGDCRLDA